MISHSLLLFFILFFKSSLAIVGLYAANSRVRDIAALPLAASSLVAQFVPSTAPARIILLVDDSKFSGSDFALLVRQVPPDSASDSVVYQQPNSNLCCVLLYFSVVPRKVTSGDHFQRLPPTQAM